MTRCDRVGNAEGLKLLGVLALLMGVVVRGEAGAGGFEASGTAGGRGPTLKEISRRVIRSDAEPVNFCYAKRYSDGSICLGHSIGRHMTNERRISMFSPDDGKTWSLDGKGWNWGFNAFQTKDGRRRCVWGWEQDASTNLPVTVRTVGPDNVEKTVRTTLRMPYPVQLRLHREVTRLRDGSLILTGYTGRPHGKPDFSAFVVKSVDDGLNWSFLSFLPNERLDAKEGENEAATVQLKDGRILAFVRTGCGLGSGAFVSLLRYESRDGGKTWGKARVAADYGVAPQAGILSDGTLFLLSGRPGVYLMLDPTGTGESFERHEIYSGGGSSYSTLLETKPGHLLLIYDESAFLDVPGAKPTNRIVQVEFEYRP